MSRIHPLASELARLLEPAWPAINTDIARSGVPTCSVATNADGRLKDELQEIEANLRDLREGRVAAVQARDRARDKFSRTPGLSQDSQEFKAAQAAVAHLGAIDDQIATVQSRQVALLKLLGRDGRDSGMLAGGSPPYPGDRGWDSSAVFASDTSRQRLEQMGSTTMPMGNVVLGEVASRDALAASFGGTPMAADVTGTANMRRGDYAGVVPQLRRRLRVLDLLPVGTMDQNSLPYTQESGSFATAAETTEGAAKPEAAITFTDKTADAVTIAHWLKLRKQSLADFPAMQSLIDNRLRYGVERRLEDEVLAGDGSAPNMTGILSTSGISVVAYDAAELVADQVLRAVTTVFLAEAEANAIVMNPLDWQSALVAKASGDGHYYSGGPFSVTPQQMWGVPLIPSPALAQGTALVGDFALGAQLFIREGVNVLLSDSDQDDFIKNRVTMLGEMRAALAVFRPAAFCTVDLAA